LRPKAEILHLAFLQNAIAAQTVQHRILPVCLLEFYENFKHCPKMSRQNCGTSLQTGLKNRQICIISRLKLANEILHACKMQAAMHPLKLKLAFLTQNLRSKQRK